MKYRKINDDIKSRPYESDKKLNQAYESTRWAYEFENLQYSRLQPHEIFHVASAIFNPNGGKVISPNFVSKDWVYDGTKPELKKHAKTSLKHWTKERSSCVKKV